MKQSCSIEILESRIAPATLVDPFTVTYQDSNGDKVMVKISQPLFTSQAAVDAILEFYDKSKDTDLKSINLVGLNASGMDISVNVLAQIGVGDGKTNVGFILASGYDNLLWDFPGGIDLGTITIDGDLGGIQAGDGASTTAIKSLSVQNMGIGYDADKAFTASSYVLGPIGQLHVAGDFYGQLILYGAEYGSIGTLTIDGALNGADGYGNITFGGTIGTAKIGQITGGAAQYSGTINGDGKGIINQLEIQGGLTGGSAVASGYINAARINSLSIEGDLTGGTGDYSGTILANSIGTVTLGGSLAGAGGAHSGYISAVIGKGAIGGSITGGVGANSGVIEIPKGAITSSLTVEGDLQGGNGAKSGSIIGGNFQKIELQGSILGGEGDESGKINAQGFTTGTNGYIQSLYIRGNVEGGKGTSAGAIEVNGTLGELKIRGDLTGISSNPLQTDVGSQSGYVHAVRIGAVTIQGSLIAGGASTAIHDSGSIRSDSLIGSIVIGGDMQGTETNPAIISAVGLVSQATTATENIAIGKVVIGGDMSHGNILAGYQAGKSILGDAINPDAQISSVTIHGNIQASNIVAGALAGDDELFGTADDAVMDNSKALDLAQVFSKISEVVVKGSVLDSQTQDAFGIVAQHVAAMRIRGLPVKLKPGAENDISTEDAPGVAIGEVTGTTATADRNDFHVLEVKKSTEE